MTLVEAIKHCEEISNSRCDSCGGEHKQLAAWLRHLKELNEFASACRFAGPGGLERLRADATRLYKNYERM